MGIVLFGGVVAIQSQTHVLDNTLDGVRLFWLGCLPGAVVGLPLGAGLARSSAMSGTLLKERVGLVIALCLGLAFSTASLTSYWNTRGPQDPFETESLRITQKVKWSARRSENRYLLVIWRGQQERLVVNWSAFRELSENADIYLRVAPGSLGFPHVAAPLYRADPPTGGSS
jgi:hypothetical protein